MVGSHQSDGVTKVWNYLAQAVEIEVVLCTPHQLSPGDRALTAGRGCLNVILLDTAEEVISLLRSRERAGQTKRRRVVSRDFHATTPTLSVCPFACAAAYRQAAWLDSRNTLFATALASALTSLAEHARAAPAAKPWPQERVHLRKQPVDARLLLTASQTQNIRAHPSKTRTRQGERSGYRGA